MSKTGACRRPGPRSGAWHHRLPRAPLARGDGQGAWRQRQRLSAALGSRAAVGRPCSGSRPPANRPSPLRCAGATNVSAWLGTRVSFSGKVSNIDGSAVDYENWMETEPNNYDEDAGGSCVRFGERLRCCRWFRKSCRLLAAGGECPVRGRLCIASFLWARALRGARSVAANAGSTHAGGSCRATACAACR